MTDHTRGSRETTARNARAFTLVGATLAIVVGIAGLAGWELPGGTRTWFWPALAMLLVGLVLLGMTRGRTPRA